LSAASGLADGGGIPSRELEVAYGPRPRTPGVHHVTLRSTDLIRSRRFYSELLGFPVVLEAANLFLFAAGPRSSGSRGPETGTARDDRFDPLRVGLDHVALACREEDELHRVATGLANAGVPKTGVKLDAALNTPYVAFRDPDGIAWELQLALSPEIEAVEAYVRALGTRDLEGVAFASDVTFESPLTQGRLTGREAVVGFLQGVLPAVRGTRIRTLVRERGGDRLPVRPGDGLRRGLQVHRRRRHLDRRQQGLDEPVRQ
jgi:catechol 2,3-dioxygenase-like lactoylglutathione lyase family enzyme